MNMSIDKLKEFLGWAAFFLLISYVVSGMALDGMYGLDAFFVKKTAVILHQEILPVFLATVGLYFFFSIPSTIQQDFKKLLTVLLIGFFFITTTIMAMNYKFKNDQIHNRVKDKLEQFLQE